MAETQEEPKKDEEAAPGEIIIRINYTPKGEVNVHSNIKSKYALLGYIEFAKGVVMKDMLYGPSVPQGEKAPEEKK